MLFNTLAKLSEIIQKNSQLDFKEKFTLQNQKQLNIQLIVNNLQQKLTKLHGLSKQNFQLFSQDRLFRKGGLLTWLILIFIFLFTVGKYLEEISQSLNTFSGEVLQIDSSYIQINGSNSILAFYFMKQTDNGVNYVELNSIAQEFSIQVEFETKIKFEKGFQISKQNQQLIECNNFENSIKQSNVDILPTQLYCFKGYYNLSSINNKQLEQNLQISFFKINPKVKNITKYFLRLIILQSQLSQDSTKSVSNLEKLTMIPYIYEYQFDMSTIKNVDVELSQILIKQREEGMLSNLFGNNDYKIQQQGLKVNFQCLETKTQLEVQENSANLVLKFKNDGSQKIVLLNSQSLVITMCLNLANFGGLLVSLLGIIGIFYGVYQKHKIIVSLMKNTFYFDLQDNNSNLNNVRTKELEKHIISINGSQQINLGSNMGKQIDYSFYLFLWMKTQEALQAVAELFGLDYQIEDKNEKMRIYRIAKIQISHTYLKGCMTQISLNYCSLMSSKSNYLILLLAKPVIKIQKKKSIRLHRQSSQRASNGLKYTQQRRNYAKKKQELFHPDKIEIIEQDSDKSCESEVNKKYLKQRAEQIQKPQHSHKILSKNSVNEQSQGQVQQSLEEFDQSKQDKKIGCMYPNKLKLWSHRQSPFLAYKNKQSQSEQSPQNQNSQTSNEDNQQNEYFEKQSFSELYLSHKIHPKTQSNQNQKQSTYVNQVIEKNQSNDQPCSSNLEPSNISESMSNQQK
ncbi:hypothetical protein ABPG72_015656 [Tetrahymena utriculariae]